jgi:5-methylcytosine-specific restriction endonuclease McrA
MTKPRDYKKEYANYHSKPEQKHNRALRNAARAEMEDRGLVRKGDGKDVDHKKPLDRGGSNDVSNLRVMSKSKNRGYRRDSKNQPR